LGREIVTLPLIMSAAPGRYTLVAELLGPAGHSVRSLRDVEIVSVSGKGKP